MANRLFSSSTVYYLRQLLEEFHRGEIILPRFHRSLVWNTQKRLELFDSIRKGIPLGSLTIWETQVIDFPPMTEFGPFVLPTHSDRKPRRYLLDGEQRLMTLYLALYSVSPVDEDLLDEEPDPFEIFFDLDAEVFVTGVQEAEDEDDHVYFPLRGLFESRSVLRFQRQLAREGHNRKEYNHYIQLIDEVAQALMECTLAVTSVMTNELALAKEVFRRVNSQSVPMSAAHMVNALTSEESSSLFDTFDDVRESLEAYPYWQREENLSNELLLLVAKRLTGNSIDEDNVEMLAQECCEPSVAQNLKQNLEKTAAFLHARGLRNPAHIPDELMLVMLANVFDEVAEPSSTALDRLEDFFWFMAYTDAFDTSDRTAHYRALEPVALALARGELLRLTKDWHRDTFLTFDYKESGSKAFAWMLARRMMEFDNGAAADTLAKYGARALPMLVRLVPQRIATRAGLRVLCPPGKVDSFYKDIRSGRANDQLLEAQAIPREAISKLRENPPNLKEFVNIRQREINNVEEKRFREILERLFSKSA